MVKMNEIPTMSELDFFEFEGKCIDCRASHDILFHSLCIACIEKLVGKLNVFHVPVADLVPRHIIDPKRVEEIKGNIIFPIEVVPVDDKYAIANGHHRVAAAKRRGDSTVPATTTLYDKSSLNQFMKLFTMGTEYWDETDTKRMNDELIESINEEFS